MYRLNQLKVIKHTMSIQYVCPSNGATHYEGASWRNNSDYAYLISMHSEQMKKYKQECDKVKHIDIKNFFHRGF